MSSIINPWPDFLNIPKRLADAASTNALNVANYNSAMDQWRNVAQRNFELHFDLFHNNPPPIIPKKIIIDPITGAESQSDFEGLPNPGSFHPVDSGLPSSGSIAANTNQPSIDGKLDMIGQKLLDIYNLMLKNGFKI